MKHICDSLGLVSVFSVVNSILRIIRILLPIIVIVASIFEFSKVVTTGDQAAMNNTIKKVGVRIIAVIIILLLPFVVRMIFGIISNYNKSEDAFCLFKVSQSDVTRIIDDEAKKAVDTALLVKTYDAYNTASGYVSKVRDLNKRTQYQNHLKPLKKELDEAEANNMEVRSKAIASLKDSAKDKSFKGKGFNLTDSQVKGLTKVCVREQGTDLRSIKFEASLMGNLADLHNNPDVYSYVKNSGWFGDTSSIMNSSSDTVNGNKVTSEMIEAVRDVLVNGNRITEANEHDCFGDIKKVVDLDTCKTVTSSQTGRACVPSNSEIKNRSLYKPGKTVIYNHMGAVYMFLEFPGEKSDPFGKLVNESEVKAKCK